MMRPATPEPFLLARVFVPKFPQLPPDVIPTIVAFAFHTGWY